MKMRTFLSLMSVLLLCAVFLTAADVTFCNAQDSGKKIKMSNEQIKTNLSIVKDSSRDTVKPKATDRDIYFRYLVGVDLSEADDEILNDLLDILQNDPNDVVRYTAPAVLVNLVKYKKEYKGKIAAALKKSMESDVIQLKLESASALIWIGFAEDDKVFSTLEDIVRGKNIETWNVESFLSEWNNDPNEEKSIKRGRRTNAIRIIANINLPKTKALLKEMVNDPEERVRKHAETWLKRKFKTK